ncbi:MAG: FAD-dependent oxidoreductase [Candidatus Hinthialibacter antarcticus]|nr:FAD-dependent oxidoreductase [Candidatus Hinthialibacter antarcticus]
MRQFSVLLFIFLLNIPTYAGPVYDLVVYGGTSSGVIAAVQAKRMGASAIIVCPDIHLGGLTSSGLGWTDSGDKSAIGGLGRDFYHRVWQYYQEPDAWKWQSRDEYGNKGQGTPAIDGDARTMWIFEPHVAEQVYEDYVKEYEIPVIRDEWLNREPGMGVKAENGRIQSITMLSGAVYEGRMFIDATYEGDLMAAAGVDYHVGRESRRVYGETWNGVQVGILHHSHWFNKDLDPYVTPGDPTSGLLPRISAASPGKRGEGDKRIQAYCYRMCLTDVDENRIPFPKPEGYDPFQYELLLRNFQAGWNSVFGKFDPIPNHKTDTNNHGPFSTDNIGYNYEYPEGSYEVRREILKEHQTYQKGLMYFIANDPRVPDGLRQRMAQWGLPKDEFLDNGGWPHQIYVREARRMIGEYVMTEQDCLDERVTPGSVGMGSYTMDSHNVQRYVKPDGFVQNEGDIGVHPPRPYEIAYGSLVPKKEQCENLLVPVCLSSSHIAFGSIRMEPVFMILGQSAATAAMMSLESGIAVQDLPYERLRQRMLSDGQVLELHDPSMVRSSELHGTVVDDKQADRKGNWSMSSSIKPYVDAGYLHDSNEDKGEKSVSFSTKLNDGDYEVRVSYTPNANRASNVPVVVTHAEGSSQKVVNQKKTPEHDDLFTSLGVFPFNSQKPAIVEIQTKGTNGHVIADAVQWLPQN